jgi:hypothetical protein
MPTGVRTPVVSMSMRVRIGGEIAIWYPGIRSAVSRSRESSAGVRGRFSGHTRRRTGLAHSGARPLYQRSAWRVGHSSRGRSVMTDSIMSSCAGSVAVSALPAFPCTDATSRKLMTMRCCVAIARRASSIEIPGNVVGMTRREPSSSGGMNSDPSR